MEENPVKHEVREIARQARSLVAQAVGLGVLRKGSPEEKAVMELLGKLRSAANPSAPAIVVEQAAEIAAEAIVIRRAIVASILKDGIPPSDASASSRAALRAFQTRVHAWKTTSERLFASLRVLGVDVADGEEDELTVILAEISKKRT